MVLLTVAGLQVPEMPFTEVVGNTGAVAPEQMVTLPPKLNVGVTFCITVTVNIVFTAHKPASGVNVYVPDVVLSTFAGLQLPVIPLVELLGNVGTVPLAQMVREVPKVNVGVMFGLTVTVKLVGTEH